MLIVEMHVSILLFLRNMKFLRIKGSVFGTIILISMVIISLKEANTMKILKVKILAM